MELTVGIAKKKPDARKSLSIAQAKEAVLKSDSPKLSLAAEDCPFGDRFCHLSGESPRRSSPHNRPSLTPEILPEQAMQADTICAGRDLTRVDTTGLVTHDIFLRDAR